MTLKGNTKNMKTSVFFNKNATPHAQSTYKMNLLSKKKNKVKVAIKSKKKKGKAKAKAKDDQRENSRFRVRSLCA